MLANSKSSKESQKINQYFMRNYSEDHNNYVNSSNKKDCSVFKNSVENTKESKFEIFKGLWFAFLSALFFSLCSLVVKYLNDLNPSELALFRFLGIFLLSLPQICYNKLNPFGSQEIRHYLVIRGITGGLSLVLRFYCIHYLPIAEASVIIFSFPIVVTIFAKLFLKEPFGIFQILIIFSTIVGLILITGLPLDHFDNNLTLNSDKASVNSTLIQQNLRPQQINFDRLIGICSGILSTIFVSLNYILLRKAKKADTNVILFNLGWVAILELSILTSIVNGYSLPTGLYQWSLIGVLVISSYSGQFFLTKSLRIEQCSPIAVIRATVDILLGFIWQIFLFSYENLDYLSISGGLIVTLCIVLTTFRKYLISLPEDSNFRVKLNFITK